MRVMVRPTVRAILWLLFGLIAAPVANAGGFDTPENAVRALEQAYVQKNADDAVAAIDFVEEGRQIGPGIDRDEARSWVARDFAASPLTSGPMLKGKII
jgi:hypothetical protein